MALKRVTYTLLYLLMKKIKVGRRGVCLEGSVVRPAGTDASADLGGSSKYSNEIFED